MRLPDTTAILSMKNCGFFPEDPFCQKCIHRDIAMLDKSGKLFDNKGTNREAIMRYEFSVCA
jgi:hypothetical protein